MDNTYIIAYFIVVCRSVFVALAHYALFAVYDVNARTCNLVNALTCDGKDAVHEFAFSLHIADACCGVAVEFEEHARTFILTAVGIVKSHLRTCRRPITIVRKVTLAV